MVRFEIPYGSSFLTAAFPDGIKPELINMVPTPAAADPVSVVEAVLEDMVGDVTWDGFANAQSAAIAINDKTRPVPHRYLLPPLLRKLERLGLSSDAVTIIIATGLHPQMRPDDYKAVVPASILSRYPVHCHDTDDISNLVDLGKTSRGTPVLINREFMLADLRIVVGNIQPHQFQGFSGGVKSSAIGLAGRDTINHNHSMMTDYNARLGQFDHNPTRQDVEEIGRKIGVHLALNAVLNDKKEIVYVIAGDPMSVMDTGIPLIKTICQVNIPSLYDLVIASPGGHPKDINVYQAQKGLAHASLITRDGGTVILTAACMEGSGSLDYEDWVQAFDSNEAVISRFNQEGFRVGPHKAYQIARDAIRVNVLLVSEMDPDFVRRLLLEPVASLQDVVDNVIHELSPQARIAIMPNANTTIPIIAKKN